MAKTIKKGDFKLNVVSDVIDFRDKMYIPTLVEVPEHITVRDFIKRAGTNFPVLDQKNTSACTGFALVTMAHFLLRTRKINSSTTNLSPYMSYLLARKYDEYAGMRNDGSSARGAMKAWHKHGLCSLALWKTDKTHNALSRDCAIDALNHPLGAYFRVNHKDIIAMHSAICETGILYVSGCVHDNWYKVKKDGIIKFDANNDNGGFGHSFVIVGYDNEGFWIQNSWGKGWGKGGRARISYDDWLTNGDDVWVARLGAPINLHDAASVSKNFSKSKAAQNAFSYNELRPHVISIGNDGKLLETGTFGNTIHDLEIIFNEHFKEITKNWKRKKLLLYAHGGLVPEETALQRLADYRKTLLENEIYPISFIWHTGFWDTLKNILADGLKSRKSEGFVSDTWDFILEKTDAMLETVSRGAGKKIWSEMKENAFLSTTEKDGGARLTLQFIKQLLKADPSIEIHFIGHSAGSIFHAPLVHLLASENCTATSLINTKGLNIPVTSFTLWAPAITISDFKEYYKPLIGNKKIKTFKMYILDDKTEADDNCGGIYRKSLLYLVSNAYETVSRIGFNDKTGTPLLGMQKWIELDSALKKFLTSGNCEIVLSPDRNSPIRTEAKEHGSFDDDDACVADALRNILGDQVPVADGIQFNRSVASNKDKRFLINNY